MRELALQRRLQLHAIIVIGCLVPLGPPIEPEMLEARRPMILAGQAETVEILRPQILPVVEQDARSEEHTSELQSLMRISYAVFCLKKNTKPEHTHPHHKQLPH